MKLTLYNTLYLSCVNHLTLHAAQCLVARMLQKFELLNASKCLCLRDFKHIHVLFIQQLQKCTYFSQGYFFKMKNSIMFKNEETNLLYNL